MTGVPGLSLRDTLAHIIEDAIQRSEHWDAPLRRLRSHDRAAIMILADERLLVALTHNTREGLVSESGRFVCLRDDDGTDPKDWTPVRVVPVDQSDPS